MELSDGGGQQMELSSKNAKKWNFQNGGGDKWNFQVKTPRNGTFRWRGQ